MLLERIEKENDIKELNHDPLKNLISLLNSGDKPVKLLVLNFLPNLRYLLHVNGLTNLPFWNLWDAILGIERTDGMPLGPESLEIPDDVRIVQGPWAMLGYRGNELAATLIGNSQGFVQTVENIESGKHFFDIYDDRGFKASTKYMDEDRLVRQDWFDEVGQCVLRYEPDAKVPVRILSNYDNFNHTEYASLDDVYLEFVNKKFANEFDPQADGLIASSGEMIRPLMLKIQRQMPVTYVLDHQGTVDSTDIKKLTPQIRGAASFVVPNYAIFEQFQLEVDERSQSHLELGYPYGADMRLGNSNEERQLIVYWNIGDANDDSNITNACNEFMDYYLKYENTGLIIATLDEDKARIVSSKILDKIIGQYDFLTEAEERENLDKILRNPNNATEVQNLVNQVRFRLWQEWQIEHPIKNGEMTVTVGEEAPSEKIDWERFATDIANVLIRVEPQDYQIFDDLSRARILVDMGEPYDARMQFNAISAGSPQINNVESPFVIDQENGWIVKEGHSLTQGLDFYLKKLGNWNVALVNTAKYMEQLEFRRQSDWWERRIHYE